MAVMRTLPQGDSPMRIMVRIVEKGDGYGRWNRVNEEFSFTHERDEPLIEFYDAEIPFLPFSAQFVSRYGLSTVEGKQEGIDLAGGIAKWVLRDNDMAQVQRFIRDYLTEKPHVVAYLQEARGAFDELMARAATVTEASA